ncbi:anthranilate synthase component I family protein [Vallicoccus soli]|uniref:Anthranilate synthase component I family protein n=1 Tax=Vallicoccus soli TaxID=2339232 RepID=A0A3A3YQT2_9ACTN|nr:anthranilate synthase component I family protein [Vallicoccus soli]
MTDDPRALDRGGWWAVVQTFEGALRCARFTDVRPAPLPPAAPWRGPRPGAWTSSLDEGAYVAACEEVRRRIGTGAVYQVNVCRVLEAPLPAGADLLGLAHRLAVHHPAPYAAYVRLPGLEVACASPELFLARDGERVASGPIKGTGRTAGDLTAKDRAENVMIVDLVRNDLGRVAVPGSVEVPALLRVEEHPGLVHLVSRVEARLRPGAGWADLLAATSPPGSVSGAPKGAALRAVADLEPVPRGPYCGAVGWVDADRRTARLAVGIRTFWREGGRLRFGTGAGVTWGSDPHREWRETELKASRLLPLASG